MKKFGKIITVVLVMVLCLFTPGTPVAVNAFLKLVPAENTEYQFEAPTQNNSAFISEEINSYDLSNWTNPNNNSLDNQQVTRENNGVFHEEHPYTTFKNHDDLITPTGFASPYVITTEVNKTPNMPASGGLTTDAINLPANGYYVISIEYRLKEQNDPSGVITNTTNKHAFGTFYLNERAITLDGTGWKTKSFYIHTDVLESADVTPELYFGSKTTDALGAIYFGNFTVTAINQDTFNQEVFVNINIDDTLKVNPLSYFDFSKESIDYVAVSGNFNNTQFVGTTNTNAESLSAIPTVNIPSHLGFSNQQSYFYPKNGINGSVMLMQAHNSNTTLTLDGYTLQPKPHEVYMFQFYSIATSADDFSNFYLTITPDDASVSQTAEQIAKISNYPYHNGWQLNTIFFIAGQQLNQSYQLGFSLANSDKTTGWVCIDEFKIYKVNGSYAVNNATATGVHDTFDMNTSDETLTLANGYFELGTAANSVTAANSGYPYPLKANDWTTNSAENGIINLQLWNENFGEGTDRPATLGLPNNNVYMMHNSTNNRNILTSSALTTTAGETAYVSFDAYSKTTTSTKAWIITASTNDDGDLIDIIYLGEPIKIETNGTWQHYEFSILENKYATSRSYYLRFEMDATGYAYIDNVRAEQFGVADETGSINLTNPLTIENIWQTTDTSTSPYIHVTNDGLTLENVNGKKTVIQNNFAYNLSANKYYEFIVTTRGKNAYLGLNGYDGKLTVTSDKVNPDLTYEYKMYLKQTEDASVNLQITLGYVATKDDSNAAEIADGNIFISNIQVNEIEETDFNDMKELTSDNARMIILTPSATTDENEQTDKNQTVDNSFFGENWWYLVPTLITAIAILIALITFLFGKIKFDKHIVKKNTSYARDMRLKNQQNKLVAQKATKVDNVTDESQSN